MQKLGFPSMRSLDQFKSLSESASGGPPKTFAYSSRPPESISSGSFANLKLTAEKLVKEQASVKTDLEIANIKLKKSMEHIRALEEKLQNAFNENAKFKVKQKEDEKLWKGLESKFSSTKTLCDQLTETLQLLAGQVQDAERDREEFEGKLSASAEALDGLSHQMNDLSIKLESAEETIRTREKELEGRRLEKEDTDKLHRNEQSRTANLIEEKDAMIKNIEESLATNRLATESLNTKLGEVHLELKLKEDEIRRLITAQENLETEKHDLHLNNDDLVKRLDMSVLEIKNLDGLVHVFTSHLAELDRQSLNFLEKFDKLNSLYEACFQLVNQERDLSAKFAQRQYDQLHDRFLNLTSEKDAILLANQEWNNRVMELQKVQESIMTQLSEERRTARETIQKLEFETEALVSKKIETEKLVSELELQIDSLSEISRSSEDKMQDLLIKISALDTENKYKTEKLQAEIQKKAEQIDGLLREGESHEQHVNLMDKQVSQLHSTLEEKEQLIAQYKEREKNLEKQITQNRASLTAAETKLVEDKNQYDVMLESKQLELSRHLKDISPSNDQAISDIWKKYEVEKLEIVNMEKQKAENLVREREIECEKKLEKCKEETRQHLMRVQEEHAVLVSSLQHEHDKKEQTLKDKPSEELKQIQLQAENELREKIMSMGNEHEAQLRALRLQHEDEIKKLEEDLYLQKSKEEKQKALLQLQWKVMSDKPEEEQEVNSKKEYSISSRRNPVARRRGQRSLRRPDHDEKSNSKGTTIFGFRYNKGVVLGGDGRIHDYDYYYDNNNNNSVPIYSFVQDNKKKTFELLNTNNSRICYACMGLVARWEDLGVFLQNQKPQSVSTATQVVVQYMTKFVTEQTQAIEDYRNKYNEEMSFGIILGGYEPKEGFKLVSVELWGGTLYVRTTDTVATLGSGAQVADRILGAQDTSGRRLFGKVKEVQTALQAMDLGFKCLGTAGMQVQCSGGISTVIHIDEKNNWELSLYPLDLYYRYPDDAFDRRSLFLMHKLRKTKTPVWDEKETVDLLHDVWRDWVSGRDLYDKNLEACHVVAHKVHFHAYRLLFKDAKVANDAFTHAYKRRRPGPRRIEQHFSGEADVQRSGHKKAVYIARSTPRFFRLMCDIDDHNNY